MMMELIFLKQTIDATVKADPQLVWLKQAEQRGDVNSQQFKELHESFKPKNSRMGQGAMLAVIIVVSALTAGAASALSNPATSVTYKDAGRFGKVMDVIAPDGCGLRTIRMENLLVYWSRRSHEYFIYCDNKPPRSEELCIRDLGGGESVR